MRFVLLITLRKSRSVKIGILFFYRLKGSRYKEIIQRKTINFSRKREKIKNYIFIFPLFSREDLPILPIFLHIFFLMSENTPEDASLPLLSSLRSVDSQ